MNQENELLARYRQQVEQSLQWGDSARWSDQDFELLSEKIFEKTQARLSVSTLKRIWGKVRYSSSPATGTLNVLARYLGYEHWRDFQQKQAADPAPAGHPEPPSPLTPPPGQAAPVATTAAHAGRQRKTVRRVVSLAAAVAAVLAIAFLLIKAGNPRSSASPGDVRFEIRKITDGLPNSVVFNYDASAFRASEVFIQQSWDPRRREKVDPLGKQHTSIYYHPGYFIAKLVVDGQIKKEDAVFIKTKGWKGIIDKEPVPVYLHEQDMRQPGGLGITAATLQQKTGLPVFNNTWVTFCNVREFGGLSSLAFTMEATLRNTATVESSVCRKVRVSLLGKTGAIVIPLSDPGCVAGLDLLAGERWVPGKENDLSAFGCDFSKFQQLKCEARNRRLTIYLNGKAIFSTPQQQGIGDIVGLRFAFEGTGEVRDVKLSGPDKTVYEAHFDRPGQPLTE